MHTLRASSALAAVAALSLLLVACGGSTATPSSGAVESPAPPTAVPSGTLPAASPSMDPGATASPSVEPSASAATPSASASASVPAPCVAANLTAAIILVDHGMGHQYLTVAVTSAGTEPCVIAGTPRVQLISAEAGTVYLDSKHNTPPILPSVNPGDPAFTLNQFDTVTTAVDTVNYCLAKLAVLPTTVRLILPSNGGSVTAQPSADAGLPPCMSDPGTIGHIETNGWSQ